jgi:hypothetical protein
MKYGKYFTFLISTMVITFLSSFENPKSPDFSIDIHENTNNTIDIVVTIVSGEPEFEYSLWEGAPWDKGKEIQSSGKTTSDSYVFKNMDRKPYYIIVIDKDELRRVKQVKI